MERQIPLRISKDSPLKPTLNEINLYEPYFLLIHINVILPSIYLPP